MATARTIYWETPAPVAVTAAATKSMLLINPAVLGLRVCEFGVSFDGVTAVQNPLRVQLYRTTTIGSPAGTAATGVRVNSPTDAAAQSTGLHTLTTEPTAVEVLRQFVLQPLGGPYFWQYPLGREPAAIAAGQRIGMRYIAPSTITASIHTYLDTEE